MSHASPLKRIDCNSSTYMVLTGVLIYYHVYLDGHTLQGQMAYFSFSTCVVNTIFLGTSIKIVFPHLLLKFMNYVVSQKLLNIRMLINMRRKCMSHLHGVNMKSLPI